MLIAAVYYNSYLARDLFCSAASLPEKSCGPKLHNIRLGLKAGQMQVQLWQEFLFIPGFSGSELVCGKHGFISIWGMGTHS